MITTMREASQYLAEAAKNAPDDHVGWVVRNILKALSSDFDQLEDNQLEEAISTAESSVETNLQIAETRAMRDVAAACADVLQVLDEMKEQVNAAR